MKINRTYISETAQSEQLSGTLLALEQQLEQIRQEQLTKNRPKLQVLSAEQQQHVDQLTSAIMRKIIMEVANEWKVSAAQGNANQVSRTVSLMWGLVEKVSKSTRQEVFARKVCLDSR